jgi:hypothetical protein
MLMLLRSDNRLSAELRDLYALPQECESIRGPEQPVNLLMLLLRKGLVFQYLNFDLFVRLRNYTISNMDIRIVTKISNYAPLVPLHFTSGCDGILTVNLGRSFGRAMNGRQSLC